MIIKKNRIALFAAFLCLLQEAFAHEKERIEHIMHDEEIVIFYNKMKGR